MRLSFFHACFFNVLFIISYCYRGPTPSRSMNLWLSIFLNQRRSGWDCLPGLRRQDKQHHGKLRDNNNIKVVFSFTTNREVLNSKGPSLLYVSRRNPVLPQCNPRETARSPLISPLMVNLSLTTSIASAANATDKIKKTTYSCEYYFFHYFSLSNFSLEAIWFSSDFRLIFYTLLPLMFSQKNRRKNFNYHMLRLKFLKQIFYERISHSDHSTFWRSFV